MSSYIPVYEGDPDQFMLDIVELMHVNRLGNQCVGFTDDEIQQVKDAQSIKILPKLFKTYLKHMGHNGFNRIWVGSDFNFQSMLFDKDLLVGNIDFFNSSKDETVKLPENIFVFISHQGHSFYFFVSETKDSNPPIYSYSEGAHKIIKVADNLSSFFVEDIINYIKRRGYPLRKIKRNKSDST